MANTFQSTGSVWSPTDYVDGKVQLCTISIHGLRVEPDVDYTNGLAKISIFQSTGSVWSPTDVDSNVRRQQSISIHGLRVEPDHIKMGICLSYLYFNPRAPCGARPLTFATATVIKHFNPRAPCGARR